MFSEFAFGRDLFLRTDHPVAIDSMDTWSPHEHADQYHDMPLSFMADFHDGQALAQALLAMRPWNVRLMDLGTATGSVPLTMRRVGMRAIGLDGLPHGRDGRIRPELLKNDIHRSLFAWHVAPEIVECCDITQPFGIYDADGQIQKFDWIISTDCFEHLIEGKIPVLVDNVWNHLADDGWGIFEVNTGSFYDIHQTVRPEEWWRDVFRRRFTIDDEKSAMDFTYVRSYVQDKQIRYVSDGTIDGYKILFWCQKKRSA